MYNDPGYPMTRRTSRGTSILAKVNGERKLLLQGQLTHIAQVQVSGDDLLDFRMHMLGNFAK